MSGSPWQRNLKSSTQVGVAKMELGDILSSAALQLCSQTETDALEELFLAAYESFETGEAATGGLPLPAVATGTATQRDNAQNATTSIAKPAPPPLRPPAEADDVDDEPAPPPPRFAALVNDEEIQKRRTESVPKNTAQDTLYCTRVWQEWGNHHGTAHSTAIPPLSAITPAQLQYWLTRFVLEVRKKDGTEYPPQIVHHLCSGILRYIRQNGQPSLDIFKDPLFTEFRSTLDAEMKRLQQLGIGSKKRQAEPLTEEEEELLWRNGLLGDHSPQALLNTMVFMNGLYFALRSGKEHRELRFDPSQISIVERAGERAYLEYTEDASKNRPGGLRGLRIGHKTVKHHANPTNPSRCFVRLFSLYKSLCPPNPKRNAFYLQCLKKPTDTVWYSREPLGHNALSKIVSSMCASAGISGFRTNHSLRATSTTRLYAAGVEEQLIMERTGHRSVEGVRSYKRTSDQQEQAVSDTLCLSKRPNTAPPKNNTSTSEATQANNSHYEAATSGNGSSTNTLVSMNASMPSSFNFHSCQSVVITFNK